MMLRFFTLLLGIVLPVLASQAQTPFRIDNAFYAVSQKQKTAPTDYTPTVTVSTRLSGATTIEIHVRDNGTGIPDALKAKIFQPFSPPSPRARARG
jgi:two-component system NtrC family sensor kinase